MPSVHLLIKAFFFVLNRDLSRHTWVIISLKDSYYLHQVCLIYESTCDTFT